MIITPLLLHQTSGQQSPRGAAITITICNPFKKAVIIYKILIDRTPLTVFLHICKSKHALKNIVLKCECREVEFFEGMQLKNKPHALNLTEHEGIIQT